MHNNSDQRWGAVVTALGVDDSISDITVKAEICLVRIEALTKAANGLVALRAVAVVWHEDPNQAAFDAALAKAEAGYIALRDAGLFTQVRARPLSHAQRARHAEKLLREARDLLLDAGATRAVGKVRSALRSANGAVRAATLRDNERPQVHALIENEGS